MQRAFGSASVIVLAAILLPVLQAQEPKTETPAKNDAAKPTKKEKPAAKEKKPVVEKISGKLIHADSAQRRFVVQVKFAAPRLNPQAVTKDEELKQQLAMALQKSDRPGAIRAQAEIVNNRA